MLERLRRNEESEGGFTLIELLIVIVILGVLAAIVVFAVGNSTSQSKSAACKADMKAVEVGLEAAKANKGAYPTGTGADKPTASAAIITGLTTTANGGPYLKNAPTSTDYTVSVGGTYAGTTLTPDGTVTGTLTAGGSC